MERRTSALGDLAAAAEGRLLGGTATVSGVRYDSREVEPGDLFVCLRGGYADGHRFAAAAVSAGAAAVMSERELDVTVPQLVVDDTRRSLATVAAEFYGHPSRELDVVGITGTDGKTTTSYILDHLLRSAGRRTGMIGTVSVRIGDDVVDHETRQTTPESADIQRLLRSMVERGVETAILEATSHGLSLHRLDGVAFDAAAVTNITTEHLEHHKSVPAYWAAKATLFERVAQMGGLAVVNLDDEGARSVLARCDGATVVTYTTRDAPAAIRAESIDVTPTGATFTVVGEGKRVAVATPLTGAFNVSNALCALAIAVYHAGVPTDDAASSLASMPQVPGRMHVVGPYGGVTAIVDYAHTPASLEQMMRLIRASNPDGRLIAVFGSAGERDVPKRSLQGAVAALHAERAVFTNEDPREEPEDVILEHIAAGARAEGWVEGRDYWCIPDRRLAIRRAVSLAEPGDVLLLAGKGHERSIIVGQRKVPWDEAAVAAEELTRRFGGPDA